MNYHIIPVTAFAQNCSVIWCETTRESALVDPGGDADTIRQTLAQLDLSLHRFCLRMVTSIMLGQRQNWLHSGRCRWSARKSRMLSGWNPYLLKAKCLGWNIVPR